MGSVSSQKTGEASKQHHNPVARRADETLIDMACDDLRIIAGGHDRFESI